MIPIEVVCPKCEARAVYRPVEYVGQFLICRSCDKLVPVDEFYPQCTPEAQIEMWHDPSMRPYLRNADFPDLRR